MMPRRAEALRRDLEAGRGEHERRKLPSFCSHCQARDRLRRLGLDPDGPLADVVVEMVGALEAYTDVVGHALICETCTDGEGFGGVSCSERRKLLARAVRARSRALAAYDESVKGGTEGG